ncbi:asparagine synthase (glutamine-hydrolyzing) [Streptomyces rubiginosohelvolus]|uniref:asparagine synthase (glutamine-hydrolyzing) n=1 Tax=unclassified Streptomyces TaxID=2593676 RepID=UPI00190AF665|nr:MULTISPECIES: asparagine synthase (glutamine-hydrolyzing) [unclassified Streptomyces]MBK3531664.1 asparagine synthase (glutamine-hydrolyzing) [Streptomyces sp. MBT72]MBK3536779.1 asparagine synthase (glutamine-hydrolyzing) [Streptomyces sp. MBT67]MBK3552417.1 asparagine synthase (glutamine-hydrolyzing) [Streptomyces sp. MBT61]MBK6029148.1 asparagine synthase (glutamine-hydrolyzing) [Streptomyces sp. MBT59]
MCGIAGWLDWERDLTRESGTVRRMADTLARRGPDDSGVWTATRIGLGHRRLAVIDPELGRQPMTERGGDDGRERAVVSFSGEIHNYRELRTELVARGHRFRTASDTEVLLAAHREWGPRAVERFAGMFAYALWDIAEQTLYLGRDPLGVKPLYYAEHPSGLVFGSEPKALFASGLIRPEVDAEGLTDVFTVAARRPGDAVYRGVRQLLPGHLLTVRRGATTARRYWQLTTAPHEDDEATTVATVRSLLDRIVGEQTVADVPLGALLSGGIDSSAITAIGARALAADARGPLATYSVDFAGSEDDFQADALHVSRDAPYVRAVVDHVGTKHSEVLVEPASLLAESGVTLRARDYPGVGDLDVSLYLLFREVRRHLTVALSGEGADDAFGGYPWFASEAERPSGSFPWSAGVKDRNAVLSPELRGHLDLHERLDARYREALDEVPYLDGESGVDRRMREVYYLQHTRFLPFLLDRKDRMSMANGLEVRVPFCDHRLVEYVWNVPWRLKRLGGSEKGLLRAAVEDALPAEVVHRPKSGFPVGQSPEYLESVRTAVSDMIESDGPAMRLLDAGTLRAMVRDQAWVNGTFTPPPILPRALQLNDWLTAYDVRVVL